MNSSPVSNASKVWHQGAIVFALCSAVLMGTIGALAQASMLDATTVTFYRLFIGAVCLLAYMVITGKHRQILHCPSKHNVINGAMLAGFMVFYVEAINYINMANAVMVIYLAPLFTAAGAHFLFAEKLNRFTLSAIVTALMGVVFILPSLSSLTDDPQQWRGYGFALLALLSYSSFMLVNRRSIHTTPYQSTLVQLIIGACCLLPFALNQAVVPSIEQWGWLLLIGFFPGFLAILLAVKALRELPTATFGTLAYMEPVTVVLLGWTLFSQYLTVDQLVGCVLIVIAGLIQTRYSHRSHVE
ncbi:EamA family transporter [Shewanella colwelliana]|uniref:DMT family transporter n=1 Tax=Shewanella colwelliana TaxID=23 RepID=UPI00299D0FBF|nr:EamA family transporter [Shewanella colwelliana]MDX1280263.1 EamA family transporter [Shewanella colwelliana]